MGLATSETDITRQHISSPGEAEEDLFCASWFPPQSKQHLLQVGGKGKEINYFQWFQLFRDMGIT